MDNRITTIEVTAKGAVIIGEDDGQGGLEFAHLSPSCINADARVTGDGLVRVHLVFDAHFDAHKNPDAVDWIDD